VKTFWQFQYHHHQKPKMKGTHTKKTTFKPRFHSQCDQVVPSVYGLRLEAWDIKIGTVPLSFLQQTAE
jgi:hypothetical protein